MPSISLPVGPPKRRIIEMAYGKIGLAGYELGRLAEEVSDAVSELNAMMLEWPFCCLGYEQPDYGLGSADDLSGIPPDTLSAVSTQLALRLAPNMGKTLSPEAHGSVSTSMALLYAKAASVPMQTMQANTPRGMGRNRGTGINDPFINEIFVPAPGCIVPVPPERGIITPPPDSVLPPPLPTPPTLLALALSASSIVENSAAGTIVGAVLNTTSGSTLSLSIDAGGRFAISGNNIVAGATATDYETATSHSITIVETLTNAFGSPKPTTLVISVGNIFEQPNLTALAFSATTFVTSASSSGTINGATAGSAIVASGLPAGLTINGAARTWAWDGTGSVSSGSFTLTETLADSANSPRVSTVSYAITAAPALQVLTLSNSSIAENSVAGTVVGTVQNVTAGSALSLSDTAGSRFAVSGGNIVAGSVATDYEAFTTHNITIVETLAGATGTPKSTTIAISVTNVFEQPNLAALTFSSTSFVPLSTSSGTINGATATSTITASTLPTGLTINGAARTWAWDGTGSVGSGTFTLTETLSDSANSPRTSTISYSIASATSLTAPTLVLTSGTADPPVITRTIPSDVGEGDYVQRRIDTSTAFNTGALRTEERILQWNGTIFQLADPVTFAPSPFTIQTGLAAATNYYLQERFRRFEGDTDIFSAWANLDVYPFQLASATNQYWTTTGVNKNGLLTVSGTPSLTVAGQSNNGGSGQPVRTKQQQTSDYSQVEVTLPASTTNGFYCGYEDGTMNMNASNSAAPGGSTNTGIQISYFSNGGNVYFVWNSGGNNSPIASGAGSWAASDVWSFRMKKSTNTVEVWRTRSGTTTLMATKTGLPALSAYYFYVAHLDSVPSVTNLGGSTYSKAIDAGCAAVF